jgi:hypothetical protein
LKVKGGKGDDVINETVYNEDEADGSRVGFWRRYEKDDPTTGTVDKVAYGEVWDGSLNGSNYNEEVRYYGGEGHDKIWLGGKLVGGYAFGGTGDDKLYGGYGAVD